MARAAMITGAQMATYDHSKYLCKMHSAPLGLHEEGFRLHFFAGLTSGIAAATAAAPPDIIKSRFMADQTGRYSSPLDCLLKLVRTEGPTALFRGWLPSVTRLAPLFVISAPLMESIRASVR